MNNLHINHLFKLISVSLIMITSRTLLRTLGSLVEHHMYIKYVALNHHEDRHLGKSIEHNVSIIPKHLALMPKNLHISYILMFRIGRFG